MAIVLFSSLVDGVRGKVGGTVFSAGYAGPYCKSWSRGSNARGARSETVRANLGGLGAAWQNLTGAERADWDTFAATDPEPTFNSLGEPVTLTGWNYFCRCNQRRLQNGQALMPLAPVGAEAVRPAGEPALTFQANVLLNNRFRITWDVTGLPATNFAMAFVTVFPSGAPIFDPDVLKFIASAGAAVGQLDAYGAWISRFGDVRQTWTCSGFFFMQTDSGLRSLPEKLLVGIG